MMQIIIMILIIVAASVCVGWQRCVSQHSGLSLGNTGIAGLTLLNFDITVVPVFKRTAPQRCLQRA